MSHVNHALNEIRQVIAAGPFSADWESLKAFRTPDWYRDGKFGIFIHWGVYCVPAFGNEWYPRNMYRQDTAEFAHHVATYGPQSQFGYKDFIPLLRAEHYDPDQWAALFRDAGARFVVPVAEHHDGFAMYDCSFSDWDAVDRGPRRDLVGELAAAVRRQGMVFGASSHRAEHWWFFDGGMQFDSDVKDPANFGLYGPAQPEGTQPDQAFLEDWLVRTCEIVDKYRPQLVWFDWWIEQPAFAPYLQQFAAFYYNRGVQWGCGVAINYKNKAFPDGTAVYDIERGQLAGINPLFWQNDTSVSKNSWGYITHHEYKTARAIVGDLVDIVSKNGALLLNVGPRADGTIPEPEQDILRDIGRWLQVNGEAIYGTRPWRVFGEGPTEIPEGGFTDTQRTAFTGQDIRFTAKGNVLYVIFLDWPGKTARVRSLTPEAIPARAIRNAQLLGSPQPVGWSQDAEGLTLRLPEAPVGQHAFAVKLVLDRPV